MQTLKYSGQVEAETPSSPMFGIVTASAAGVRSVAGEGLFLPGKVFAKFLKNHSPMPVYRTAAQVTEVYFMSPSMPLGFEVRATQTVSHDGRVYGDWGGFFNAEVSFGGLGFSLTAASSVQRSLLNIHKEINANAAKLGLELQLEPIFSLMYDRSAFNYYGVQFTASSGMSAYAMRGISNAKEGAPISGVHVFIENPGTSAAKGLISMLRKAGAQPMQSMYPYLLSQHCRPAKPDSIINELPGLECEIKFLSSDASFNLLLDSILSGRLPGFSAFEPHSVAFKEAIDEYVRIKTGPADVVVRRAYNGKIGLPKLTVKGEGEATPEGILVRSEEPVQDANLAMSVYDADCFARIKKSKKSFLASGPSGRVYDISLDLSQDEMGRQMVQLEIEYKGIAGQHASSSPMEAIRSDIALLADYVEAVTESKRTSRTKMEWLRK